MISSNLSIITVPNACMVFMLVFFATEWAFNNSPSLNAKIPLPKYPIIVDEKTLFNGTLSKGSNSNCQRYALTTQLNTSKKHAIDTPIKSIRDK